MRPKTFFSLGFLAFAIPGTLVGCGGASHSATQASVSASPSPLRACETRELQTDETDMVLQANIDGTLASITIVHSTDRDAQDKAVEEMRKAFGNPHRDNRTMTHQSKWGILEITDACGRPIIPASAAPSPT
ncbi:MAG: hypothetical protein M3R51_04660 [Candidatus Eremiobacteraeota bacterium]|nr:hypothetical protein [Candidatus Eremiobacteraeota bacterium]